MRKLLFLLPFLSLTACHAQVPPTTHSVNLTWTAPIASGGWTGCGTPNTCTYVVSRLTLAAGKTACDPVNLTTPNYTPLNSSSPVSATSFTDTGAVGTTACYIAQTEQGGAVSQPSNTAGPLTVPASPGAPSTPNGTVADLIQPPVPKPNEGSNAPSVVASLHGEIK
jgi:hypothetical protein